uniref:hypothetical protein n=1 Tax=Streptomyces sp. NRRL S-325 TaxID=1463899 RepID=UPI00131C2555|nr:hypothetical protein [Streptomyces sp. NRRL S-325]
MENTIMPSSGVTIDVSFRELPFIVIGLGAACLSLWTSAPPDLCIPAGALVALRITMRRGR